MQMRTVVELPDFERRAKAVMSDAERMAIVSYLAAHPDAGIALGGGLRKVRFARAGGGKSGGFRTIHYFNAGVGPVFLLTLFAKNEKANLTAAETAALMTLGNQIADYYGRR
jgi:hypothetical protein